MTVKLTDPISKETVTDVTLDAFGYTVSRNADLTVNVPGTIAEITVSFRDEDGTVLYTRKFSSQAAVLPTAVRQAIKGVHEAILTWAVDNGKIPPGTNTPDF